MNNVTKNTLTQQKDDLELLAQRQQTSASDPKACVWVEASAGTGKTKVLTDRVLRLLLCGADPSKILCLTYTKAAAVEMKSRVYAKLSKWVACSKEELKKELLSFNKEDEITQDMYKRARILFALTIDSPAQIKIQTIHAFCEEILKRFPLEAGVVPYFEVMDDVSTSEAINKIIRSLLIKFDDDNTSETKDAISFLLKGMSFSGFQNLLGTIAAQRNKLSQIFDFYGGTDNFLQVLQKSLNLDKGSEVLAYVADFEQSIPKVMLQKCADALLKGSKTDQENGVLLKQNLINFSFDSYKKIFLTKDGTIKKSLACKEAVKNFGDIISLLFAEAERVLAQCKKEVACRLYKSTKAVVSLAGLLISEYRLYKQQTAQLDYEDLIIYTKNLLEKADAASWVLYKLDGGLEHILIDEAQDTSPNQWAIIKALTDEFFSFSNKTGVPHTIFAVGDRKQSIYGFQGAEPEKFDEMCRFYQQKIENFKKVRLDVSFRSTSAVLKTVNALFELDEAKKGVALEGTKVAHLPFRLGEAGYVALWPLEETQKDEDEPWYPPVERRTKKTVIQRLSLKIADKIKQMVETKDYLVSKNRPVRYSDFMVLVQRRNAFMEEFVRACKAKNVAICGVDKMKLGDSLVVEDLISLAKFLLLPEDDLSLAEVLKSPLYNLSDADLFELCFNRGKASLWHRLNTNLKYTSVCESLSKLLRLSDIKRPFELFSVVLTDFDGRKNFYARIGLEAKDALDEFMNLTLSFERSHVANLQNFVTWFEKCNTEVKRELEQDESDAVRIMTVHGSKGLQAPIVILADTVRETKSSREAGLLFDKNMVYAPLSADDFEEKCDLAHDKMLDKTFDEYRRLLYVAMTRAEDRLYIAGYGSLKKEDKSWYGLLEKTLKRVGKQTDNGEIVFETPQILPYEEQEATKSIAEELGETDFVFKKAPVESAINKPYSPSHMDEDDSTPVSSPLCDNAHYFKRGSVIHKILELLLFQKDTAARKAFVEKYLAAQTDLSPFLREDIKKEVFALLDNPQFSFLFSPNTRAEVPVMGKLGNKIVSGQIDRLVVFKDKVIIVDFKTNRPAATDKKNVPPSYIRQLNIYKQLLVEIYEEKTIEAYILWTNTLKLMKI